MKPRVGHIVWYRTAAWEGGPLTDYAAIIVRMERADVLDLVVFDPNTVLEMNARRGVAHDPTGETPGTWRWPVD